MHEVVAYELSTGRPAFTGATDAMVTSAILHDAPPVPRALRADLPAPLEDVILKSLAA